ncbi:MAG TPA: DNA integrity scanning diadenylate cyclase DisA, partial [Propionibacteriaceae bacterium]|nr:DNA integrity scanning diadenylate cyclase DisA [Propionibacteriaceae bacterium]
MPTIDPQAAQVRRYQALLAPGTPLREGLERIARGRTGALVVMGTNDDVEKVATGGFAIDVNFTPTALRELAKMDGGIILSDDLERILRAGVHFVPDRRIPTFETGTRHRSADQVAQQTGIPVVTVSASMSTIALFLNDRRYPIEASDQLLSRANSALATLTRYRERLIEATRRLSALEVADQVTVKDVAEVCQRLEMLRRLDEDVAGYVSSLGIDGRLVAMQLADLRSGIDGLADNLARDYRPDGVPETDFRVANLATIPAGELLDLGSVAAEIGFASGLNDHVAARGFRQLAGLPHLSPSLVRRVV